MLHAPNATRSRPVVVGISGRGLDACREAVRLGAEEAALREAPLRLVHGSLPPRGTPRSTPAMDLRQQRGRRLVNGAAHHLLTTAVGSEVRITTESTPETGLGVLLRWSQDAELLVLQRDDGWGSSVGLTVAVVVAEAGCPTLLTSAAGSPTGDLEVLLVLADEDDPAPAVDAALVEARLRRTGLTVLEGGRVARPVDEVLRRSASKQDVAVHRVRTDPDRGAQQVRELSRAAALMVVLRDADGGRGTLVAADDARCPVLSVPR